MEKELTGKDVDYRSCAKYLRYLVHNHVQPRPTLGDNGFRAWTQNTEQNLVKCDCDFGGCKNAELHEHYRVRD
jgi:hypothetical protein